MDLGLMQRCGPLGANAIERVNPEGIEVAQG